MSETVYVAVYDSLADWEYGYLVARINSPAFQSDPGRFAVRTVSADGLAVTTMGGICIEADLALDDVADRFTSGDSAPDAAMLVLPGADAWASGSSLQPFARLGADVLAANAPVAAICGAVLGLAREGVLDERAHTGNSRAELDSSGYAGGAHFRDADAVIDRGLITAPATEPVALAREVFRMLGVFPPDVLEQWSAMFGRRAE